MSVDTASEPRGTLTIRTLAMPGDTNPAGDIFGGWVRRRS
jgi:acyl-CoA thioesterase YciA